MPDYVLLDRLDIFRVFLTCLHQEFDLSSHLYYSTIIVYLKLNQTFKILTIH